MSPNRVHLTQFCSTRNLRNAHHYGLTIVGSLNGVIRHYYRSWSATGAALFSLCSRSKCLFGASKPLLLHPLAFDTSSYSSLCE